MIETFQHMKHPIICASFYLVTVCLFGGCNTSSNTGSRSDSTVKRTVVAESNDADTTVRIVRSKQLTGRVNGWLGIAPDGRIFIYSFARKGALG